MELIKKNIHMNRHKGRAVSQLTLDDDYNVPDTKLDIGKIIQEKGDIKIDEVKTVTDRAMIKGALSFSVLYMSDMGDKTVHSLEGKIPFEEAINIEGAADGDSIRVKWDLEDLSISLINSRKLSVKTIVTFLLSMDELYDEETAVELHDDDNNVEYRNKGMDILQIAVNKKDIYRIKDEISLASNKPNIYEILWNSVQLRSVDARIDSDKIDVKGELVVFVLYSGEDEENSIQWLETIIPFSGFVDCGGCMPDMISNVAISMSQIDLEAKPDYDGEQRLINVDAILELDIKLYSEEHVEILKDIYSPSKELVPVVSKATYDTLLVRNFAKCRTSGRLRIQNDQSRILQICHGEGTVKVDEVRVVENGIEVEGVINVQILYVTSDDTMPFNIMKGDVPFQHVIEAKGIDETCLNNLSTDMEQLSTTMIDSEEIELKATINLNALVIRCISENNIIEVKEGPLDMVKLQELPGIVGYFAAANDTLWDIAKKYYTTVENLMETNELTSENIRPGDRLIIVKKVETF